MVSCDSKATATSTARAYDIQKSIQKPNCLHFTQNSCLSSFCNTANSLHWLNCSQIVARNSTCSALPTKILLTLSIRYLTLKIAMQETPTLLGDNHNTLPTNDGLRVRTCLTDPNPGVNRQLLLFFAMHNVLTMHIANTQRQSWSICRPLLSPLKKWYAYLFHPFLPVWVHTVWVLAPLFINHLQVKTFICSSTKSGFLKTDVMAIFGSRIESIW